MRDFDICESPTDSTPRLAQILWRPSVFANAMIPAPEEAAKAIGRGPDPNQHAARIRPHLRPGIGEVYVQQIRPDMAVPLHRVGERRTDPPARLVAPASAHPRINERLARNVVHRRGCIALQGRAAA